MDNSNLNLNLNSETYNNEEIEILFNLKMPYNQIDINNAKQKLITQLFDNNNNNNNNKNNSLEIEKQREIHFFIDTIASRIINKININSSNINSNNINSSSSNSVIEQGSHFIIENNNTINGRNTKLNEGRLTDGGGIVPPGYMNPINVRTITQTVNIDTRFRPNYYGTKSTHYQYTLPSTQKNVVKMRLSSIELPMSYHAVSRTNGNSTCLIIDNSHNVINDHARCWVFNLPDGNYEQSWANESKASHIEPAMNNAISTAVPAILNLTTNIVNINTLNSLNTHLDPLTDISFTLDRVSGRAVFASPSTGIMSSLLPQGFTIRFNVDETGSLNNDLNIQLRLGWQLGFRSAEYICNNNNSNNNSSSKGACVSEGICLVCGPRYGLLSIEDYQKNTSPSYIVAYADSIIQNNVITRINLSSVQADVGVYQVSNDPSLSSQVARTREYFGAVDIQKLFISLYDEFGRVIDLNNMDWSFTLDFEKLYD
jgi:hypothetical protein